MSKDNTQVREDFIFKQALSDIPLEPKEEEDPSEQLFKNFSPKTIIDSFEKQLGFKQKETPAPKVKYKHVMLSPGVNDDDSELLDQLMNDPELYTIASKSQHWTVRGEYKLFIEYMVNLDVKKAREEKKEKANE